MADFGIWAWVALFYEIAIIIVFSVFLSLVIRRYLEKKNKMTRLMVKMFVCYQIGILFSIVSKFFNARWGGVPYESVNAELLWLVARLHAGRFGFMAILLGTFFAYQMNVEIFEKKISERKFLFMIIFTVVTEAIMLFLYEFNSTVGKAVQSFELVAFAFMLVYMIAVYFPFMIKAFLLSKRIEEPIYCKAVKSLGVMAMSLILIFLCFVLDRLMLILFNWAYSIFYFLGWVWAIIAIYAAYAGYIMPSSKGQIQN
jgi:hypothetical protein